MEDYRHPIEVFLSAVQRDAKRAGFPVVVTLLLPDFGRSRVEDEVAREWSALPEILRHRVLLAMVGDGVGTRVRCDGLVDPATGLVRRHQDVAIRGSRPVPLSEPFPEPLREEGTYVFPRRHMDWLAGRCARLVMSPEEAPFVLLPGELLILRSRFAGITFPEYLRRMVAYLEPELSKFDGKMAEAEALYRRAATSERAEDWLRWPLGELERQVSELGEAGAAARRILDSCADEAKDGPDRKRCFRWLEEVRKECGDDSLIVRRLQSLIEQAFRRTPMEKARQEREAREAQESERAAHRDLQAALQAMVKARQPKVS